VSLAESLKDGSNIFLVFINRLRPNDYVVQVYVAELSNMLLQSKRHTPLVGGWGVTATHWHYDPLSKTKGSKGHHKLDMFGEGMSVEKGIRYIDFTPDLALDTVSKNIVNTGEQKCVWGCYFVQQVVVDHPARKNTWICFRDDKGWRSVWRGIQVDVASSNMLLNQKFP